MWHSSKIERESKSAADEIDIHSPNKAPIASSIWVFTNWDIPFPLWFGHYVNEQYCNLDDLGSKL